jgi:D-alanyl-D-alanine carboxypeptidase/D-alanyl-D-alanine-endopeptidase (penicillin-binding protein 4)
VRRRSLALWTALGLVALPAASPLAGSSAGADPLAERLAAVLEDATLRGARVGALVVARDDGRVLFAHEPDLPLVPASNQKLLTALAALAAFGPAHRFETALLADRAPDARGAVGTLYVRGGGDPALATEDWWRLAGALRAAGVRRVAGDLVVDDSLFDAQRWHPLWGAVTTRGYYGPVGALTANFGAFAVEAAPGATPGGPARVSLDPPIPWLRLEAHATTGDGVAYAIEAARSSSDAGETVRVTGRTPAAAPPARLTRSVSDPARYAGELLRWQLAAQGVPVAGAVRRGVTPAEAAPLLTFPGRPLAEIVRLLNKSSHNAVAESVVKSLAVRAHGPPGDWPRGVAALDAELRALGLPLEGVQLADGSGLARENRVTARLLVAALRLADRSFGFGPELETSLPIAATDGTLRERGRAIAGHVRAKTGFLSGVAALSGYASPREGGEAVFALLVNGAPAGDMAAVAGVDAFAAALVGEPAHATAGPPLLQESVRRPLE